MHAHIAVSLPASWLLCAQHLSVQSSQGKNKRLPLAAAKKRYGYVRAFCSLHSIFVTFLTAWHIEHCELPGFVDHEGLARRHRVGKPDGAQAETNAMRCLVHSCSTRRFSGPALKFCVVMGTLKKIT